MLATGQEEVQGRRDEVNARLARRSRTSSWPFSVFYKRLDGPVWPFMACLFTRSFGYLSGWQLVASMDGLGLETTVAVLKTELLKFCHISARFIGTHQHLEVKSGQLL